ncbi:hypothetical protein FA13DRAFT_245902 [Coprinellus micaceus]|nr:hypothetical protein FA13DRAFT_1889527 [Coprinellus micaceus]TEB32292.1 hypothetical protein FA13DRAFT_245902 [Coprinellus micaceus]
MNHYTVYHMPLHTAHPVYHPCSAVEHVAIPEKRDSVVNIVNVVWEIGAHILLSGLSRVITPLSSVYDTRPDPTSVHYLTRTASFFFVWMPSPSFVCPHDVAGADYATLFDITCDRPYKSLALAFMLLRLSERLTRQCDYARVKLVNLSYKFYDGGVHGVLFYDKELAIAYNNNFSLDFDTPVLLGDGRIVTVWNATLPSSVTPVLEQQVSSLHSSAL